jgi:hypothetical protein
MQRETRPPPPPSPRPAWRRLCRVFLDARPLFIPHVASARVAMPLVYTHSWCQDTQRADLHVSPRTTLTSQKSCLASPQPLPAPLPSFFVGLRPIASKYPAVEQSSPSGVIETGEDRRAKAVLGQVVGALSRRAPQRCSKSCPLQRQTHRNKNQGTDKSRAKDKAYTQAQTHLPPQHNPAPQEISAAG